MDKLSNEISIIVISSAFLFVVAIGIIILVLVYQKRQLQYLSEKEQLQTRFDRQILESRLEIQEQTFRNLSQEIHDNIGQVLSLVRMNLGSMEVFKEKNNDELLSTTKLLVAKVIQDLRDLSKMLNADYVSEIGLNQAIEHELEIINRAGIWESKLSIEGGDYRLGEKKEVVVFRIVQEVLNNIIKHANGNEIFVKLEYLPAEFLLAIYDNGVGFDLGLMEENKKFGLGIRNMRNRANLIGAEYSIFSTLGSGTQVHLRLPI
jgi:two-component system, NarL family, sensor kinase